VFQRFDLKLSILNFFSCKQRTNVKNLCLTPKQHISACVIMHEHPSGGLTCTRTSEKVCLLHRFAQKSLLNG